MVRIKGIQVDMVHDHFQVSIWPEARCCCMCYAPDSTVCGMPEVPNAIRGLLQPIREQFVFAAHDRGVLG
jgi:hypothetical protein